MKARVTLVNPSYPVEAPQAIFIPLGISYLAAVLERDGYVVDVLDLQSNKLATKELEAELERHNPNIVGVTSATLTYNPATEVVKAAKRALPNCLTLMGGPHVTVLDKETLSETPEADIVVRGEGEETMLELANLVSENQLYKVGNVAGVTFRKNGQIIRTIDRPFIQNIDELPYPAHRLFQIDRYKIFDKVYMPIVTSRGCPYECAFCLASKICGKVFRARSPRKVADELEWLRENFGAGAFAFYDDTFTFDVKRAIAICDEMKNRKINLPWDCRTRVDRVSKELLAKLSSTNCQLIHFGVESGSQKMLNIMRKGTTVGQNSNAIKLAKEAGIFVAISLVIGYPGETPEMLQQTIDFIQKTKPDYVYMCEAVPYPGTELYYAIKQMGIELSKDWNLYHEDAQVFKNPLVTHEMLEETKKTVYDSFFSPTYYLQKRMGRNIYSKTMARMALNHLVWKYRFSRWAVKKLGKMRQQEKTTGGYSKADHKQQI